MTGADDERRAEIEAATDALLADSGLPRYGGHRATIERRMAIALEAVDRVRDARSDDEEAPPYPGPRRWLTCPECGSTDEASDTPCTNLGCPSHDRRKNVEALCERAEMDGAAARSPQGEDHEAGEPT